MQRTPAIVLTLMLLVTVLPSAEAERTEYANYLPGVIVIGISCSGEQHEWVPTYTPDAEDLQNNPIGWALSGEPECAPADLYNNASGTNHPTGFGAVAFEVVQDDTMASVTTYDDVFGPHDSYLVVQPPPSSTLTDDRSAEGCGPQVVHFSPDMMPPWPDRPYMLMWVFIYEVGVEDDLSRICFASAGSVEATIT